MIINSKNFKKKFHYALPKFSTDDEDKVLYKRLYSSLLGIIIVIVSTILILQFFGPLIFTALGYLSIDKWQKHEEPKSQTAQPHFSDVPKATKNKTITIKGFAEPKSAVKIYINGPEAKEVKADQEGNFVFDNLEMLSGQNIIFAKATQDGKTESTKSETIYVNYDKEKPEIVIISPKDGESIENVDSRITVKGNVKEEASVTVNSHLTIVDSEGNFQTLISVKEGDNKIIAVATDQAGNEATASITIKFDKR